MAHQQAHFFMFLCAYVVVFFYYRLQFTRGLFRKQNVETHPDSLAQPPSRPKPGPLFKILG